MELSTIPEAIEDIKEGKFVIIVDDENRENEGDLAVAAERLPRKRSTLWPSTAGA